MEDGTSSEATTVGEKADQFGSTSRTKTLVFYGLTIVAAIVLVKLLLVAGAHVHAPKAAGGSDALGLAATSIHPVTAGVQEELMAFLLARGASVGGDKGPAAWSKLINGCHANGRPGAAEFLARHADGLDLEAAAGVGRLDIVETFFDANGRLTPNATDKQVKDGFTWVRVWPQ